MTGIDNEDGGNPLVPDVALYPFPSNYYLAVDPTTPSGRRVQLPDEALPDDLPASMFAAADGFSPSQPLLAWFAEGIDPATLPTLEGSIDVGASVQLLRVSTAEAVPIVVEVDGLAAAEEASLILRPYEALRFGETYVAVITDTVRAADGGALAPSEAFVALRDHIPTDSAAVELQRDDFGAVHQVLGARGLDPDAVVLAWPFTVRSEAGIVDVAVAMHDAMMGVDLDGFTVTSDVVDGDNRLVEGTIEVPDYLDADLRIRLDDEGLPIVQGTRTVDVLWAIPETVAEPRPVIVFGHGFFSSREEITWSSLNSSLQVWEMSAIATDFVGFREEDALASAAVLGSDLAGLDAIMDQQLQSQAHFTVIARLASERFVGDYPDLVDGSTPYLGISNGGTQGAVITTVSPVIDRAALVVPGGGWSHMTQRAVQWWSMGSLLSSRYPDSRDLQLALSLTQLSFDRVDGLSFSRHLVADPLPGRTEAEVTLHEAVGDCQVANVVTEMLARTAGIPLITPSARDIWGLETTTAAPPAGATSSSGLIAYDEGYDALPEGNVPPTEDNGAHETIRDLAVYVEQVGTFLETGAIVQVCDGACDPD